jgi:insecticidal toxin complex protein TccC
MSAALCRHTPKIRATDSRGLAVRDIAYHRHPDSPNVGERINRHRFDERGFLVQSTDSRLHALGLTNFEYLTDMAGNVLRTRSADAGISITLNDAAGRPSLTVTGINDEMTGEEIAKQGVFHNREYENDTLPGRLLSVVQQIADTAQTTERFVWGGNTEAEQDRNLAGQCVGQYDPAGLLSTNAVLLSGVASSITRRLLNDADNPDTVADWQGQHAYEWNALLEPETDAHTTQTTTDATGTVLTTLDAVGNQQRRSYDVQGLLAKSWLKAEGELEQPIIHSLAYSASGEKLREEHGNGVVTTYTYEPETQRLILIKTQRPSASGIEGRILQDLGYEYDPVGNVLSTVDAAGDTRHWHNQKVEPVNTYVYDSLYQLIFATGREMANAHRQTSRLPHVNRFDNATYTLYSRTFIYDEAGNLVEIRHRAAATNNSYTTEMTVSDRCNRAVRSDLTEYPSLVSSLFTPRGNQTMLSPGQQLVWDAYGLLRAVTPVTRASETDDYEGYRYGHDHQRVLKVTAQKNAGAALSHRVVYLPGLEWRTTTDGIELTQSLQVALVGEGGRARVRLLLWKKGRPTSIANHQLRYGYGTLTGNIGLELDNLGEVITREEYYPYGGTAILSARSQIEADFKTARYSGKERDCTGLYYYGYRYYEPWAGRWLSADPAKAVDGLNLYRMVKNNPVTFHDDKGLMADEPVAGTASRKAPSSDNSDLIANIRSALSPLLEEVKITDTPRLSAGMIQYTHDENHPRVRQRRAEFAKALNKSSYEAKLDRAYQLALAAKVSSERDRNGNLFGQCAEMAYLTALKLESQAETFAFNLYTFQITSQNHTLVLLSRNSYKSGDTIDWKKENAKHSVTVDLWQAAISGDKTSMLADYSSQHHHTKGMKAPSIIQARIWGVSKPVESSTPTLRNRLRSLLRSFRPRHQIEFGRY